MAATSSMIQQQFSLSPPMYPEQYTKTAHYPLAEPSYQTSSQISYQFKDSHSSTVPQMVGHLPYSYQFMHGYQMEPQQTGNVPHSWTYGAAIQGIVPEPERFGDLCEKGLVPIITTPTHEVTNPCNVTLPQLNTTIKSEPLKVVPQQSCETTYVTTSQPLMCHSTIAPHALSASLDYNYTPCPNDQIQEQIYPGTMGWPADIDPFYSSDMRSVLPGQLSSNSNSSSLPSPWDYYRTSNT